MRAVNKRALTLMTSAALMVLSIPVTAAAQWTVTPYVGGGFGGATEESLTIGAEGETTPWNVGVTAGWTRGWIGVEADVSYAPRFFDEGGGFISSTSLMTAMGNARLSMPLGGVGMGLQPYASAGAGMIRPKVAEPGGLAEVSEAKFGWNVGGGVTGYFTDRVGVQADVRYFRTTADAGETNPFGIQFDGLDFWRLGAGLAFRW